MEPERVKNYFAINKVQKLAVVRLPVYSADIGYVPSRHFVFCLVSTYLVCFTLKCAQAQPPKVNRLSLQQALALSVTANKTIEKARIETDIAEEDVREKQELKLPEIDFHSAYAQITNLTEFRHGLGDKVITHTIPVIADVTTATKMPLYSGGRIKHTILRAEQAQEVAGMNLEKTINDVQIDVIGIFLRIYKMMELQKLILENINEEQDRLKEVKAFKAHGTVTKNEVLRAELQLSDMQLTLMTNKRNIAIGAHDLQTILQLDENEALEIDTTGLLATPLNVLSQEAYAQASLKKEEIRMSQQEEAIRQTERKIVKGNYYPTINLFAAYAFNYPNYMFFPPDPYLYTLGRVGIEATFNISSLYKNKTRMHLADKRIQQQQVQTEIVKNAVSDDVFRKYIQLEDIRDKIAVTEKASSQASENYRIVRVKYLNQLALITEMIDADNALLQARFNAVSARIDAVMKLYELNHASGLL